MERKIGEVFEYKNVKLIVKRGSGDCIGCYFYKPERMCVGSKSITGECTRGKRDDGNYVVFAKVENVNEDSKQSILDEAKAIVEGSRQSDYGDPVESFDKIAKVASMITGGNISPKECCAVLMAVKIVRESFKHKRDNLVDLCGYAHIMNEINESEKKGEQDAD